MSNKQDFTGYTESDAPGRLTITADSITATGLDADEDCYIYKDFTAAYFSADFEHSFKFMCTGDGLASFIYLWTLSNAVSAVGDLYDLGTSKLLTFFWRSSDERFILAEGNGSNIQAVESTARYLEDTPYYIRIARDENAGTYGTLYAYIYADPNYETLYETITCTLRVKTDFRYLLPFSGDNTSVGGEAWSGYVSNLVLETYILSYANLIAILRTMLNEDTANFWTDTQFRKWINDAIREIASETGAEQKIDTAVTVANTRLVSFAGYSVGAVEYIPASGRSQYLRQILPNQVGHVRIDGVEPQYWYEWGSYFGIEPIPQAIYNLRVYVNDTTYNVAVGTDIPNIPAYARFAIIYYVMYKALVKDNKLSVASMFYSMYRNELMIFATDKIQQIPTAEDDLQVN